jgi:sulfonate transport system substrate-binding protein
MKMIVDKREGLMGFVRTMLRIGVLVGAAMLAGIPAKALDLIAQPTPLSPPVKLIVGVGKSAHHAPIVGLVDQLKALGVELEVVEFNRYADARTAIATGSLDISSIAAGDLAVLLSQGVKSVVAFNGVASSKKFPIVAKGVVANTWAELKNVKLGVPPGSAVWYQFVAKLQEVGIPYDEMKIVNIQGAPANFWQALKRGDVQGFIHAEPAETIPVVEGFGGPATTLDYSDTKAVGSELGLWVATKNALEQKREASRRFVWAYLKNEHELAASPEKFATSIQSFFGVDATTAKIIAEKIKLGSVTDSASLIRLSKYLSDAGIISRDVSKEIPQYYDESLVRSVTK